MTDETIPYSLTLYPTMKEFKNFHEYVENIERTYSN
jgi:hypothetical protein